MKRSVAAACIALVGATFPTNVHAALSTCSIASPDTPDDCVVAARAPFVLVQGFLTPLPGLATFGEIPPVATLESSSEEVLAEFDYGATHELVPVTSGQNYTLRVHAAVLGSLTASSSPGLEDSAVSLAVGGSEIVIAEGESTEGDNTTVVCNLIYGGTHGYTGSDGKSHEFDPIMSAKCSLRAQAIVMRSDLWRKAQAETLVWSFPAVSCAPCPAGERLLLPPPQAEAADWQYICATSCKGDWYFMSTFDIDFPDGWLWVLYDLTHCRVTSYLEAKLSCAWQKDMTVAR